MAHRGAQGEKKLCFLLSFFLTYAVAVLTFGRYANQDTHQGNNPRQAGDK
jgi:hypothetical protein